MVDGSFGSVGGRKRLMEQRPFLSRLPITMVVPSFIMLTYLAVRRIWGPASQNMLSDNDSYFKPGNRLPLRNVPGKATLRYFKSSNMC